MSDVATSTPVTDAVVTLLRTLGRPVGDGKRPAGPEKPPNSFFPYLVVNCSIVRSEGTLVDPHECALHRVEVRAVGLDRAGCDDVLDAARTLLHDRSALTMDEHAVMWSEDAGGQGARPDFDVTPPRMFAVAVVNLYVSPI